MSILLNEPRQKAIHVGLIEIPEQIDNILESVLYGSALPAHAICELDSIWEEVELALELALEPLTEHELKLHHPLMA